MPPRAPVAPSIERSSLVLWLGDGQAAMLDDLDRSVVGAVAVSLPQAARNATALTRARRDLGLGLMPDLESWRLQLALDHPLRGPAWRALGMDGGKVYKPDARRISEAAAERQGTRAMDAQTNSFDPTIFTTPAHWLPEDQAGVGRRNDLALAQACADIVASRDLAEPTDDDRHRHRRRLYASLMVDAGRLRRGDVEWILDAYCGLGAVDGYVVWAVRFNRGLLQARLLQALTDELQQRSGRPVIAGGLSHFHTSALTRGLAATCVGPGRGMYPMLPPPEPEEPDESTDKPKGRAVCVYHGAILGSFGLRKSDDARRRRAFMRHACACGAHPAQEPPATHEQIVAHNRFWLMHEARQALEQPRARSAARLAARIPDARRARADLGMTGLAACWSNLSAPSRSAATG